MHQHRKLTSGIKAMCEGGCSTPVSIEVAYESGEKEWVVELLVVLSPSRPVSQNLLITVSTVHSTVHHPDLSS